MLQSKAKNKEAEEETKEKKKISTEFPQLKHSKKQKYYEDTKKGEQEKNETPSTMLSWSEKKKKDICSEILCSQKTCTKHSALFIISSSHIISHEF